MSTEITTAFVKQFGANVFHLSQQQGSVLRNCVRNETVTGDSRYFDRIGKATAQTRTSRHSDTPIMNTPHSRRRVSPIEKEYGDLVDDMDKVKTLNDPTNDYSMAAQWALGRAMDTEIIEAASGTAYTGVAGATSTVLPTTQKIASISGGAGSAFNVQALRRARKILEANDVNKNQPWYCTINAWQKENLLGETEVTSSDYNSVKALVSGEVNSFLGFEFKATELIQDQASALTFSVTTGLYDAGGAVDGNGYDKLHAWAKAGLLLGISADIKAQIAPRADKSFSTQVYASLSMGAVRMEEEAVVEILCKDT